MVEYLVDYKAKNHPLPDNTKYSKKAWNEN
jgi:hypothetical protein